ncbi:MAG: hypothetical protein U0804_18415 [Gemmataceae bacterium]
MSTTRSERQGQVEVGIVSHEGREFAALGASVHGRDITAYTKLIGGNIVLTTWCGKTMLACRSEVVRRHRDDSLVILFRLTRRRFVVGYALGDNGMLFRGELLTDATDDEARRTAVYIANLCAAFDGEDAA